jgi:aspartate carbamoyltransferase catalytic subunit
MKNVVLDRLQHIRKGNTLSTKDILSIDDLSGKDILLLCELARVFRETKTEKIDVLKGFSAALAFFESSVRTRSSFEWAGKHLGIDTINVGDGTAEKKGETFIDIAQTLDMMQAQFLVVRTSKSGLPSQIARHTAAHVINAGDGWHEHPSQALLDFLTILDEFGDAKGKTITFVGDILHSRVFGSTARIFQKMGLNIRIAAPATLLPEKVAEVFGVKTFLDVEEALVGTDIVYALRVQNERGATGDISTIREYSKAFGISEKRFALANKGAILMHPGPIQRDTDVHHVLANFPQSRILHQIENGLAIRKAIFWMLGTGEKKKDFIHV